MPINPFCAKCICLSCTCLEYCTLCPNDPKNCVAIVTECESYHKEEDYHTYLRRTEGDRSKPI